jgi:hypothetical protein
MISEENLSMNGAVLTKRIVSARVIEDNNVRSYIPRSQRVISWIEKNADELDNRKSGNLKVSFKGDSLQICEEIFHQVS